MSHIIPLLAALSLPPMVARHGVNHVMSEYPPAMCQKTLPLPSRTSHRTSQSKEKER